MARILEGWALRYGDRAPSKRTELAPRARIVLAPAVELTTTHTPWTLVGAGGRAGASVVDVPGRGVWVSVPVLGHGAASDAWLLVRAGVLAGWSVEWDVLDASIAFGWRVVHRAFVARASLVVRPAFPRCWVRAREG